MSINFSIFIPVYEEEKNLPFLLTKILQQKIYPPFRLDEIVVIVSGSDNSEKIAKNFSKRFKNVKVLKEGKRGKARALNKFLKLNRSQIVVMISGDVLPADKFTINTLLQPFLDEKVGMSGGRVIPSNPKSTLTNRISALIWHLHHKLSSAYPPKVGEIVAFRALINKIDSNCAADEEMISALIQKMGYKVVYVKDAVVYNKAPAKISELIAQRKRIFFGHLQVYKKTNYLVPTMNLKRVFRILLNEVLKEPSKFFNLFFLSLLEIYCRILGWLEFCFKKDLYANGWEVCKTTKSLVGTKQFH